MCCPGGNGQRRDGCLPRRLRNLKRPAATLALEGAPAPLRRLFGRDRICLAAMGAVNEIAHELSPFVSHAMLRNHMSPSNRIGSRRTLFARSQMVTLPHAPDRFEETDATLFCSDLFHHFAFDGEA